MVVVAIIAILLGIILPSLRGAQRSAKRTACAANLRSIGVAFRAYLNDSNDYMPIAELLPSHPADSDHPRPPISSVMSPYVDGSIEVFRCPADQGQVSGRPDGQGEPYPFDSYFQGEQSSYQYNVFLGGQRVERTRLSDIFGEANVPILFDYNPFHGPWGERESKNFLFGDGHAGPIEMGEGSPGH